MREISRLFFYDFFILLTYMSLSATWIKRRKTSDGRIVETVHCNNPACDSQILRKFEHFVSKKAMNIEGLSSATLERFLELGYLDSFQNLYHLDQYREDITSLDGFGEKSYERLWSAITKSRETDFVHFLVAMDIPIVGRTKSRILNNVFSRSLNDFEAAAIGGYDFTVLEDFKVQKSGDEFFAEPFTLQGNTFPAGITRTELWHWFDDRHPKGVAYLLYGLQKE